MDAGRFEDDMEVCRSLLERIAGGDVEGALALCGPEVEMLSLFGRVEGGTYRGHDGMREWFRDVIGTFDDFDPGQPAFAPAGDALLMSSRGSGRGKASGVEIRWEWHALARVREGKIERWAIYPDERTLREAEGIG